MIPVPPKQECGQRQMSTATTHIEKKKALGPKLRFKEFKGEWLTHTLEEISDTFKSGDSITSKEIFDNGEFPVYGGNGLRGYTNTFTHDGFYVLIGRQGALCGNINRVKGKTYISEHAIAVRANNFADTEWLAQKLDDMKLNRLSESSAQPGLAVGKLLKLKLHFPTLPEQQKIASFLSAIDEKIQQLTRKKELLALYKKGVMQQLFSGKLRFKGENGKAYPKWEEKRLGEISTIGKGKGISKTDIVEDGELECIRYGELYTRYKERIFKIVSRTNLKKGELVLSDYNDVIIPGSGETQLDIARAACVLRAGVALGGDLNILRSKQNGVFLSYYINYSLKYEIAKVAQGNSVVHLYPSQLEQLKIWLPILSEQNKIAESISSIDDKAEHLEAQITQTQTFKKGLLQQMFV